jgi:hypothetical protein
VRSLELRPDGVKDEGLGTGQRQVIMKNRAAFSEKPIPQNALSSTERVGTSPYLAENIPVRRIQIQELVIYDIREDELDDLVCGGRASNYQTHAVWSLSTALTLLSFLFVPSLPKILFAVFAHLTTFGFAVGLVLPVHVCQGTKVTRPDSREN